MKLFIGVDVGKYALDIYCNNKIFQVSNDQLGLEKFYVLLQEEIKNGNEIALVICEATGGYEVKLVKFVKEHNLSILIEHANKVRNYAKSKGLLAKTDKIDARLLSEYAEVMKVKPTMYTRSGNEEKLVGLIKRREQLKRDKIKETIRLDKELDSSVKKSIKNHAKWLEKETTKIDNLVKKLQEEDKTMDAKVKLLTSVPTVGNITAYYLIAFLPELGSTLEAKQMAALAGLAPYVKDSGKHQGKRFIQGGRSPLRSALYMASLSGITHYQEMREFYQRLRNKGKPAKVALMAVARKLLTVLNSVMYRRTPWVKEYTPIQNVVLT